MLHLIVSGFVQCPWAPLRNLHLAGRPGWAQGEGGGAARQGKEGETPAPVVALYRGAARGQMNPEPQPAVPWAPGDAARFWLQRVVGVRGKEGQTHYVTLCLLFFLARVYRCGKCVCSHPIFIYVPERFFPLTLLYKMNVSALNYEKNPPVHCPPRENTEQFISLNAFYPKLWMAQTEGCR